VVQPGVRHVQFVDGDCEVVAGWLPQAQAFLDQHPQVAAVCGRRRERYPERSVYNRLCDQEWDTPVGEALACGGDVMMNVGALQQAGGYRDSLIAGEEPELCVRLRAAGWKVWRLDAEMTLHDAAMLRWGQWWRRTRRAGYAFAEGAHLHGHTPERHWVREHRRAWLWGVAPLVAALLGLALVGLPALLVLLVYPLQMLRMFFKTDGPAGQRALAAAFLVLGKLPEAQGALDFLRDRLLQRRGALIEYK
jgi:GT2 family glycosyltransferase